jgi:hypothetical protein
MLLCKVHSVAEQPQQLRSLTILTLVLKPEIPKSSVSFLLRAVE